jgi:outer membrane murein-binding lipoprotein Lpp
MNINSAILTAVVATLLLGCGVKEEEYQRIAGELRQATQEINRIKQEASSATSKSESAQIDLAGAEQRIVELTTEVDRLDRLNREYAGFIEAGCKLQAGDLSGAVQAYTSFVRDFPASPQATMVRERIQQIWQRIAGQSRTWSSAGGLKIVARYLPGKVAEAGGGNVPLLSEAGAELKIPLAKLSDEDRAWIAGLPLAMQPQAAPPSMPQRVKQTEPDDVPKIAAKPMPQSPGGLIREKAKAKPVYGAKAFDFDHKWTKFERCRLLDNASNDGDSFHVKADGKEYIFRLYEVDTPESETDSDVASRIKEQSSYFGISEEDVLAKDKKAKEFSRDQLQQPFTVMTRFLDAMGRSRLPRNYAFIITADGEDLGQVLVANGLARAWGQRAVGQESIYDTLKEL